MHLFLVLEATFKHQPTPVDGPYPADNVDCGEHLDESNRELGLAILLRIAHT